MLADGPDEAITLLADLVGATDRALAEHARRVRRASRSTWHEPAAPAQESGACERSRRAPRRVTWTWIRPSTHSAQDPRVDRRSETTVHCASLRGCAMTPHCACWWTDPGFHGRRSARNRSGCRGRDHVTLPGGLLGRLLQRLRRGGGVTRGSHRRTEDVLGDLFTLRGFGITDLGLALRTAADQLSRSAARRRVAVLLSDCRATAGGDPLPHAAGIDEVAVLAPADDTADAEAFAAALGGPLVPGRGAQRHPSCVP
ncbi:MAG: hypothetical protein M5U19_06165 [Microthrixaceae bacterium]|nr:hypothetical protein [Microthrixaceae bacterium]